MVIMCNIAMLIYLVTVKPFAEENQQTATVVDEIVIMICVSLFILLYVNDATMDLDSKKNMGWVIIIIVMFSVLKNFGIVIYFGIKSARKGFDKIFGQED